MALADEVTARLSTQQLVNLTNPQTPNATTADSTRLAKAVADVSGMFRVYANDTYDNDDNRHVVMGVEGVILVLEYWQTQSRVALDDWIKRLRDLGKVTGRNRLTPVTSSSMTRDAEVTVEPFDINTDYQDIIPNPPTSTST